MIDDILFPVDFQPACVGMAAYVRRVVTIFGSRVTLVYVCDLESHNAFELYMRTPQEVGDEHWNIARRKIESFLNDEVPMAEYSRLLRTGEAEERSQSKHFRAYARRHIQPHPGLAFSGVSV